MSVTAARGSNQVSIETLRAIERRALWLAVRIVDYANRERPRDDALKVGGHQASSASMVTLMTALWLADTDARDRVSVKPHAAPVLHALEYLLGRLDRSYLSRLRELGGLQSHPSGRRTHSRSRRRRCSQGSPTATSTATSGRRPEANSSHCSAMQNSTRGTCGRRS